MLKPTYFILIATFLFGSMHAEAEPKPDEIQVGPIAVPHQYQGVTVNQSITAFFMIVSKQDGLYLNARIESDLHDLQNKFGSLIDTAQLPKDNCRSFSGNNPVVSLPTKSITPESEAARITLGGEVKMWDCRENPVPEVYWDPSGCRGSIFGKEYSFGCPKTRPGSPIKNVLGTQPFDFTVPVYLRKIGDKTVALVIGDPSVNLGGQYAFITRGILNIAGIDLNAEAKKSS